MEIIALLVRTFFVDCLEYLYILDPELELIESIVNYIHIVMGY